MLASPRPGPLAYLRAALGGALVPGAALGGSLLPGTALGSGLLPGAALGGALVPGAALLGGLGEWVQVAILGLVEGLTEFLPISSTGHLIVTSALLGFGGSLGGTFEIFIQLGAVLAVVGYYSRDLFAQTRAVLGLEGRPRSSRSGGERSAAGGSAAAGARLGPGADGDGRATAAGPTPSIARRFWLAILIAFLPAAVIGLALHRLIKRTLFRPSVIAGSLAVGGVVLIAVERIRRPARVTDVLQTSLGQALAIGVAQVVALVPGVSRSGASIVGGLLAGLDRTSATVFAFYLAIPTLGGATIVDLLRSLDQLGPGDLERLLVGAAVALVVAWASIAWLLRYVSRSSFVPFGVYRLLAGAAIAALVVAGRL